MIFFFFYDQGSRRLFSSEKDDDSIGSLSIEINAMEYRKEPSEPLARLDTFPYSLGTYLGRGGG